MCWHAAITMRMTLNEPGRHKNKPLRLRVLWYYGFLPQSKYIVGVITGDCKLTVGVNGCLYLCVSLPQTGNLSRLDADSHPDSWDRLQPLHLDTWIIRFNHCAPYKINKNIILSPNWVAGVWNYEYETRCIKCFEYSCRVEKNYIRSSP